MEIFKGFWPELQTPKDLLVKLESDYFRLESDPINTYAAFDFFVTAEHIIDWSFQEQAEKTRLRKDNTLLKIVSHLGNGAKHFIAERHSSVAGLDFQEGAFDPQCIST